MDFSPNSDIFEDDAFVYGQEQTNNLNLIPYSILQERHNSMSLSAPTLRPSPYSIPPPRSQRIQYCNGAPSVFSSGQLQQQSPYSISYATSPPSNSTGPLAFQGLLPCSSPPSMLPPASTTSIQLPGSHSQNSMLPSPPAPRRHSLDGHESPINPGSPLLEDDSNEDQYKFRPPPIGPMGINPAFNSFTNSPHQSPPLPSLGNAMGYPNTAPLCPTPMYSAPDSCQTGGPPLGMSVWGTYPPLPNMNLQHQPKLSMDSPRFKLTPERAGALVRWFERNKEHPYPTRHEKLSLCSLTQLTYTQVSTWFANARRRMKKNNNDDEDNRENREINEINSEKCSSHNSSLDSES